MPVQDLWLSKKLDANGERLRTKRYGRGLRWREYWTDPDNPGKRPEQLHATKKEADKSDHARQAAISAGTYIDPKHGKITVAEWATLWRGHQLHRDSTAERTERMIRLHILPMLGRKQLKAVRVSNIRLWVQDRVNVLSASTLRNIYSGMLVPMFSAAVDDGLIIKSPCIKGIRLPAVDTNGKLKLATTAQVHALCDALPARYRAIPLLAAGCGWRWGEIFGAELQAIDFAERTIEVTQQLKIVTGRKPYLASPKTVSSARTNELGHVVAGALDRHINEYPPMPYEIDDDTDSRMSTRRDALLLFTSDSGRPMHRRTWARVWVPAVKAAGLPVGFGLHDLRHYFATLLIFGGANVKTVQQEMGHTKASTTLDIYADLWPDMVDEPRHLVDLELGQPDTSIVDTVDPEA